MKYEIINKNILNIIIGVVLFNCSLYSQDCGEDLTYFATIPAQNFYTNDNNQCFHNDDIAVLDAIIELNSLTYESPLMLGPQTWIDNRLFNWVLTYQPGDNGINQLLSQLPNNFGQLSGLSTLFMEKHYLTVLPDSFTQLSDLKELYISNNCLSQINEVGFFVGGVNYVGDVLIA